MKQIVILTLLLNISVFAVVITGNQDKVSVTNGGITVTGNDGITQNVDSGEITFMNENGVSKSRKIQKGDLNDIYSDLKAADESNAVNLKFDPLKYMVAKKIKAFLGQKGIERSKIQLRRYNSNTQIYIKAVSIKRIKSIYPAYYKVAKKYFSKPSNKGKVPTLTIKKKHIYKYHKKIIRKYDR
jgi:hypothetical protein